MMHAKNNNKTNTLFISDFADLVDTLDDEIHYWLRVLRRGWKMPFSFLNDDDDLAAKFLIVENG